MCFVIGEFEGRAAAVLLSRSRNGKDRAHCVLSPMRLLPEGITLRSSRAPGREDPTNPPLKEPLESEKKKEGLKSKEASVLREAGEKEIKDSHWRRKGRWGEVGPALSFKGLV